MVKFILIHGSYGYPEENWFPWLSSRLNELGHEVIIPKFPTPENQELDIWMEILDEYIEDIDEETIFVAHSLGPSFIFSVLEKIDVKVKACFFIAGFVGLLGLEIDSICKSFVGKEFDWNKINGNCEKFVLMASDNDPYVPIEKGEFLAEKLNTDLKIITGAGHFNEIAGYKEFEELLKEIKKII